MKIKIQEASNGEFAGWPIKFIDDLIVFYDLQGRIHTFHRDEIVDLKLHNNEAILDLQGRETSNSPTIEYGDYLSRCFRTQVKATHVVYPSRVILEQANIDDFLSGYESAYTQLEWHRERMAFYSRPKLFQDILEVGLRSYSENEEVLAADIPIYLLWSGGDPYHHQTRVALGMHSSDLVPNIQAESAISTDYKFHIFTASISLNRLASRGGEGYYVNKLINSTKGSPTLSNHEALAVNSYNNASVMGVGGFSFSVGSLFPVNGIWLKKHQEFREILSPLPSALYRIQYIGQNHEFWAVFSQGDFSSATLDSEGEKIKIKLTSSAIMVGDEEKEKVAINNFDMTTLLLKTGVTWSLNERFKAGVKLLLYNGKYSPYFNDGSEPYVYL